MVSYMQCCVLDKVVWHAWEVCDYKLRIAAAAASARLTVVDVYVYASIRLQGLQVASISPVASDAARVPHAEQCNLIILGWLMVTAPT